MTCILLTDADRFPLSERPAERLRAERARLISIDGHDPEEIAAAVQRDRPDAILVYHARFDAPLIGLLDGVRVLGRCGTGYDRIDVDAARAGGIEVTYVPDYAVEDVADHTVALLLACCRGIVAGALAVREQSWPAYDALGPLHRLRDRTLGLLGFGRIARAVAARAASFGMRLLAYDPGVPGDLIRRHKVEPVDFDALLRGADVLSVHVPLTTATEGLLGEAAFAAMRPGAVLINTSRGEIIDERALLSALGRDGITAAGLDVFTREPLPLDDPLRAHPRVVATPHTAAFTEEALSEVAERALDDVFRVLGGADARHPVAMAS